MIKQLIINDWKKAKRSAPWLKNLAAFIFFAFCVLYMLTVFLGASIIIGNRWDEISQGQGLPIFFQITIYYFALTYLVRLFAQMLPDTTIHYYRLLPISNRLLINYSLLKSIVNVWLLITLVLFIPFGIIKIMPQYGVISFIGWIFGMISIDLFFNYLAVLTKKTLDGNLKIFILIIALTIGIFALDYYKIIPIGTLYVKLLSFSFNHPITWIAYFIPAALIYYANYKYFRANFYAKDKSKTSKFELHKSNTIEVTKLGNIWTYFMMEIKLVTRNRQLRNVFIAMLFLDLLICQFFKNPDMSTFNINMWIYMLIGSLPLSYLCYTFTSESTYWDLVLTLNIDLKKYIKAKTYVAIALTAFQWLIASIILIIFPHVFKEAVILTIYNIGFCIPALLFIATYSTKRMNMGQKYNINQHGMDFFHAIIIWIFMFLPSIISAFDNIKILPHFSNYIFIGLGIIGIILYPLWIKMSYDNLKKRKYKMAECFREKN